MNSAAVYFMFQNGSLEDVVTNKIIVVACQLSGARETECFCINE